MFNFNWPLGVADNPTHKAMPSFGKGLGGLGEPQHVVVEGLEDGFDPELDTDPEIEMAIATEDDFEDDCPLCESMRERVRNGERIEIIKMKFPPREEAG